MPLLLLLQNVVSNVHFAQVKVIFLNRVFVSLLYFMEIPDLRSRNCFWDPDWERDGHLLVNFFFPVPSIIQSQRSLRKLTRLSLLNWRKASC